MSMFISKALRRAEVFLEKVDESVAQASRRLVVEGATGDVDESEDLPSSDEETAYRRAASIPRAEERAPSRPSENPLENVDGIESTSQNDVAQEGDKGDAWGLDISEDVADDEADKNVGTPGDNDARAGVENHGDEILEESKENENAVAVDDNVADVESDLAQDTSHFVAKEAEAANLPMMLDPVEPMAAMSVSDTVHSQSLNEPPSLPIRPAMTTSKSVIATNLEYDEYVAALKAESAELRKELESVESDFERSRRERSKLIKNLKRMKEIVSEMDESLREKSAEARDLEAELVAAKDEISSLRMKSRESDARGKDDMDLLRKELNAEILRLQQELTSASQEANVMREENERLKEALLHGHEVDLATADGARQEASQAHKAYEAEAQAHRETKRQAKEREEALEAEAALATTALAAAQRKTEECTVATSNAKSAQKAAESKLATVTAARDAAFARVEDLQEALKLYENGEGNEPPGQKEAKEMRETVYQLETALEAKNVELNRLEGEVESLRLSLKSRRDVASPRASGAASRNENGSHQEIETKLRHMADSALRKQAQLEVLRSENRALQHQLATERKRTREAQAMAAAASSSRQTIRGGFRGILDGGEEDRGERAYGVRDGPLARFRTPRSWPRSVSKVVNGIDRLSAQALAFLRKEPLLRIVLLVYLVGMHIFIYSLLHWHVDVISGSVEAPHRSVASASSGKQIRNAT